MLGGALRKEGNWIEQERSTQKLLSLPYLQVSSIISAVETWYIINFSGCYVRSSNPDLLADSSNQGRIGYWRGKLGAATGDKLLILCCV